MPRPPVRVIAMGASAGGVEALSTAVSKFPADTPAAVVVVLHVPAGGYSVLPAILSRAGPLPARHAKDGDPLREGEILVAPPDYQMTVGGDAVVLERGPRENGFRPSIDVLFRSVAQQLGPSGAGVVLSGILDDGAAGLAAIKQSGGFTVVQEPGDATFPDMPAAAIKETDPQAICPAAEVAECLRPWLEGMLRQLPCPDPEATVSATQPEDDVEAALTEFTCPECGGTLWHRGELGTSTYRCRVGHGFSSRTLLVGKQEALEAALWAATVALQERKDLLGRIRRRLAMTGRTRNLERYDIEIDEAERRTRLVRDVLDQLLSAINLPDDEEEADARTGN